LRETRVGESKKEVSEEIRISPTGGREGRVTALKKDSIDHVLLRSDAAKKETGSVEENGPLECACYDRTAQELES